MTVYEIRDRAGELRAFHTRVDGPDGKRMAWRGPDGSVGLDGTPTATLPLFGVHLLDTWPDATVVVCEGEKAAQALQDDGVAAVGTVTGASGTPSADVLADLAGRGVICWPDADQPGIEHMARVADLLTDVAAVGWMDPPPTAPKGWDGADAVADSADIHGLLITARAYEKGSAGPDVPSGRNQGLTYLTARQLAAETAPEVPWRVKPYVADGAITELDGKAKAAGKTTWLLALTRAVLEGNDFLGQRTRQTAVVLMSEQGRTSLRAALTRERLLTRGDLYLVLWHDVRGLDWAALVKATVELCREKDAGLLIVDTLPQFARLSTDAENDAGAALKAMEPLQAAAAEGLAVLMSRHDRKGGGDVGESGRGSGAFTGTVDIVLALRRGDGESRSTIRHLHGLSRFDEVPAEVVIELADGGYLMRGTAAAFAIWEARAAVLGALADGASLTLAELVTATDLKRTSVQTATDALVADKKVVRDGLGKKGDPYKFSRVSSLPEPIPDVIGPAERNRQLDGVPVESVWGGMS